MKKVAINGMGRMGRLCLRALLADDDMELAAVNDIAPMDTIAYLVRHDTEHGPLDSAWMVKARDGVLSINGHDIPAFNEADASKLPWGTLNIDLVLECTGSYTSRLTAQTHIEAGAGRVLISAAAGNDVPTVVYGINESIISDEDLIISGASCSTVGLSPLVKALNEITPLEHGISTTIHALTSTQVALDNPQRKGDLRRSRTASTNIIPTTAAAAQAVGLVIPELKGKLSGSAIRVPVTKGSYITLTAVVKAIELTRESLNAGMKERSSELFGYADEELVSSDIAGTSYEAIFDPYQTKVAQISEGQYLVETAAWFDNETSYVAHFIKLAALL
jgi:glyceraldehyde 3-phosphate dehydrogenase